MIRFFTKYHKWIGLLFTFFILMFALSGVFLNHRRVISAWDIARAYLPANYAYVNWNNGTITGTLPLQKNEILIYGNNGVWLSDTFCRQLQPLNKGLRKGADNQTIRAVTKTKTGEIFSVSPFSLYRLNAKAKEWQEIATDIPRKHYFTDLTAREDTLILLSRSFVYEATPPYSEFKEIKLSPPENYKPRSSLFRTLWLLHSGELFGVGGKIVVDIVGIITVVLCITGLVLFFFKIPIKRLRKRKRNAIKLKKTWGLSLLWHNKAGNIFFVLLLITTLTGMFLRPPLLIAIIKTNVPPLPLSSLDSNNAWHDKLRKIRFDNTQNRWLLSTSDGFYTTPSFGNTPQKITATPPVSVMGVNVIAQNNRNEWIIGSFSGLYGWDTKQNRVWNYATGKPVEQKQRRGGRPVFTPGNAISGFSTDFAQGDVVFDYNSGAKILHSDSLLPPMPSQFAKGKISFWNFCLELHVGRLYHSFMRSFTDFYIFVAGLLMLFIIISGYVVYRRKHRKKEKRI